jgi:ABC-type transport system involved in Fe-S cluster assembly fused permease/ATPase subunit
MTARRDDLASPRHERTTFVIRWILVLHAGRLFERGTHDESIALRRAVRVAPRRP